MTSKIAFLRNRVFLAALTACALFALSPSAMLSAQTDSAEKEKELIGILKSNASPAEKAITCKRLAVYGSADAVPAIAPLLLDPDLSSWARIPLEAIPDPACDAALRDAMGKAQGRVLVGIINSIGVRRDTQAVDGLIAALKNPDADVAGAAAVALGHIGGEQAARALLASLAEAPAPVRSSVAEGCVLCAEQFLAQDRANAAVRIYDTVKTARVPKQRVLEATRGAILARQSEGIPLLIELLRSEDKDLFGIALRTARELPGRETTQALAGELAQTQPERQAPLLLALGDRKDEQVLPAVLGLAKNGSVELRLAAIGILDQMGETESVPVLLEVAAEDNRQLSQAAMLALTRLEGTDVDNALLARLPRSKGRMQVALIELSARRRITQAVPAIERCRRNNDPAVRSAAVDALGTLGGAEQAATLVGLISSAEADSDIARIERALNSICSREGQDTLPHVLPLVSDENATRRVVGLHVLASVGGPMALTAVKTRLNDPEEGVQDEAVRTLAAWPGNWPEDTTVAEPLLELAKSGRKASHQIQGMRGYLTFVQETTKLQTSDKVSRVQEALPLINRPEEKRLAIAVLGTLPTTEAVTLLLKLSEEQAVAEEAYLAIVSISGKEDLRGLSRDVRRQALQAVVEKSGIETTKKRAQELL